MKRVPNELAEKVGWPKNAAGTLTFHGPKHVYISLFAADKKLLRRVVRGLLREGYGAIIPRALLPDIRPLRIAGFYDTTFWRNGRKIEVWRVDPKQEV